VGMASVGCDPDNDALRELYILDRKVARMVASPDSDQMGGRWFSAANKVFVQLCESDAGRRWMGAVSE